ncbi:MAG TPA: hypothetical protein VN957_09155 [Chthoniobacterales bacterium]|jgi:hypothetical protein|nr:hypothetical protein [Chthoniobacterales bacterium]
MPLFISRRGFFAGLAFSLLLTSFTFASTVNIPQDNPAVSVDIPDSWKPEETDKGVACESPDKVATIFFEVTSSSGLDALIDENVDWLTKDQGVQLDKASEQKQEFEAGNLGWKRISWGGTSKEWGPATVGFAFTDAGNGKVLTVTYWITKKDQEKHFPTIEKIFESVKRTGS